ncbi:hypothetical protein EVAR_93159_1 [Eumeta japonica]|uniref:Uncharacterized protein n=1 Tax=Eumeta variegata TaxID=151549 RepID=A0A4C1TIE4_EUMVA|nr:hypothetical protein EVAR_93159_1 [Eumeta japonica]
MSTASDFGPSVTKGGPQIQSGLRSRRPSFFAKSVLVLTREPSSPMVISSTSDVACPLPLQPTNSVNYVGRVAVVADIREMFLQVKIREEDTDSLRFLWRENENEEPKEFRMNSLIFGASSSPCSAIYVKIKNAQEFADKYRDAALAIEKHFYMDDYLQAFPDIETATRTIFEINEIHKAAAFQLRGWASNEPDALVATESLRREQKALSIGDHTERTLGLIWKTKNDTLSFR